MLSEDRQSIQIDIIDKVIILIIKIKEIIITKDNFTAHQ